MKRFVALSCGVRRYRIFGWRRAFWRHWRLGVFTAPREPLEEELKCICAIRSERGGENTSDGNCPITPSKAPLATHCGLIEEVA